MATRKTLTSSHFNVLAPALTLAILLTLSGCSGNDAPTTPGVDNGAPGGSTPPPPTPTPALPPPKGNNPVIGNVTLSWYPPTERTDGTALNALSGYRIVFGTKPRKYNRSIRLTNPGLTRYYIDRLGAATWYFAIIAIDAQGMESAPSTEVSKKIG